MNNSLRISFDHQIFSAQRYGGISRYIVEVVRRLSLRDDCEPRILALAHVNSYLASLPRYVVSGWAVPAVPHTGRVRQRVDDVLTTWSLRRSRPDVVHESYYSTGGLVPAGVPTVVTVHDMIHEKFPRLFPDSTRLSARKLAAVNRAAHVICVSENTRRDLLELFPTDPQKVSVIYLGTGLSPTHAPPQQTGKSGARPYLLYVGDRSGYKNFHHLVSALAALPRGLRGVPLIAFGGGPLRAAEIAGIVEAGLPVEQVIQMHGDDALLARMYAGAAALVYPSLYEGFGIPVVEAMVCGCPVVCSNTGSLPEIVGDAAEFCDPTDVPSLTAAIRAVLESPARAAQLRRLGSDRQKAFSWDACSDETYAVYKRAAG